MDLCGPDPRYGTREKVLNDVCGTFRRMEHPALWLRKQGASRDNTSQECEDYGRVITH